MRHIVITGGPNLDYAAIKSILRMDDRIICADGGALHAQKMGLKPDKLVGDLDSILPETLAWVQDYHIEMEVYSQDKDMTDSEICLRQIPSTEPIVLICSLTGRPDHVMTNLMLAGQLSRENYRLTVTDGSTWVYPLHGPAHFRLNKSMWRTSRERAGLAISFIPLFSEVMGVTTLGLKYKLQSAGLMPGSSFSVSNSITSNAREVGVDFSEGVMLVMVTPEV